MKQVSAHKITLVFFTLMAFLSCESMPGIYSHSKSWLIEKKRMWGTVSLLGVTVDRIGSRESMEREISDLAPLYFWEEGCQMISSSKQTDYVADIQLQEREYRSGWKTKRSILVAVRVWPYMEDQTEKFAYAQTLPLAAGRVITTGERSLSSFDTTNQMLSLAIQKAMKHLASQKRKQK